MPFSAGDRLAHEDLIGVGVYSVFAIDHLGPHANLFFWSRSVIHAFERVSYLGVRVVGGFTMLRIERLSVLWTVGFSRLNVVSGAKERFYSARVFF